MAMRQNLKHIRIYGIGFFTCIVGKGLSLISQGRLEPNENFAIKPCNPTKLLRILGDLNVLTNRRSTQVQT